MRYAKITQALDLVDAFCHGEAGLTALAITFDVPYHPFFNALLSMDLITVRAEPRPGLTTDYLIHAILLYYLFLLSGKRKTE